MGKIVNDGKGKAQILVEQFQSVFTRDDDQQLPDTKKRARHPISPLRITTNGVKKLLQGINIAKAQGPDKIANIMLKKVQVGKDQEKAQSERDSHSKNRGGKKPN